MSGYRSTSPTRYVEGSVSRKQEWPHRGSGPAAETGSTSHSITVLLQSGRTRGQLRCGRSYCRSSHLWEYPTRTPTPLVPSECTRFGELCCWKRRGSPLLDAALYTRFHRLYCRATVVHRLRLAPERFGEYSSNPFHKWEAARLSPPQREGSVRTPKQKNPKDVHASP